MIFRFGGVESQGTISHSKHHILVNGIKITHGCIITFALQYGNIYLQVIFRQIFALFCYLNPLVDVCHFGYPLFLMQCKAASDWPILSREVTVD